MKIYPSTKNRTYSCVLLFLGLIFSLCLSEKALSAQTIPCQGVEQLGKCRAEAEQGLIQAQFNLGLIYERGDGVPQNYVEARKWYQMAADQGDPAAQVSLGLLYAQGQGAEQNYAEARNWFQKAADQGNAKAKSSLAILYAAGLGVPKDEKRAKALAQEAADQGDHTIADVSLDIISDPTSPYHADYRKAADEEVKKIHALADQGDAKAQDMLGDLYAEGKVVSQNFKEAVAWWRKAAERGLAKSQYNLGVSYVLGKGVAQDNKKAKEWLQKASDQGNLKAREALKKID